MPDSQQEHFISTIRRRKCFFDALTDPYVEHIYEIYDGILAEFVELSADEQTRNMSGTSSDGMDQMIDYIYDHYDNFRLLLKCGDSGKFEDFIHNMVEREVEASQKYMKTMCDAGIEFPAVSKSLMHMIYTGFFSSVLQIIEHDMDRGTAKKKCISVKGISNWWLGAIVEYQIPG